MASESSQSSSPSPSSLPSPSMGSNVGDTFIGSFISLISKYEIRYEGILCHLNVQDSTLGLQNVRNCGTEGRKKDGPQVPPCDRVYEYILFRGSDIKDLQVNPTPSAQPRQEIQSEQNINQSRPAMSPPVSGYGLGRGAEWGHTPGLTSKPVPATQHSPVPSANTFEGTHSNVGPSMPMPSFVQGNSLASTGGVPLNKPQIIDAFASPIMGLVNDTTQVVTRPTDLASNPNPSSYSNPSPLGQAQLHTPPGIAASSQLSAPYAQNSYPIAPQAGGNGFFDSAGSNHPNRSVPSGSPPGPFSNSPPSFFGMQPLQQPRQQMVNRGQEMFGATNQASANVLSRTYQAPLLPLPVPAHQSRIPSSSIEYTEEFDFEAMNEKFKKSELWGFLGKNNHREETAVEPSEEGKTKPAYNKDDFFDTISCNQLNQVPRSGQQQQQHTQFPEHMRQNPEVYGNHFQRPLPPQPGQGAYLAAQTNYRGGYDNHNNNYYSNPGHGYGYGYYSGGRGRGRNPHF
ncbi:unnamed protein product [Microthlaspi erraticum]|uniref:DFDF domain-containing protein n=1 Tax=Microthlaspi erraticum TaxID=1685480 RepID=A0A6D2KRI6_9BRAS|nr:unnamed protein product [Microthlaspi erraticum]CAA7057270.1 unnamed protein product [Microthlaspi erraticum]